jgi:hypothetical protein
MSVDFKSYLIKSPKIIHELELTVYYMLVIIKIHFLAAEKLCFHYAATADAFDTTKGWEAKR